MPVYAVMLLGGLAGDIPPPYRMATSIAPGLERRRHLMQIVLPVVNHAVCFAYTCRQPARVTFKHRQKPGIRVLSAIVEVYHAIILMPGNSLTGVYQKHCTG